MDLCQRFRLPTWDRRRRHCGARWTEAWTLIQRGRPAVGEQRTGITGAGPGPSNEQVLAIDERQPQEKPGRPQGSLDLTGTPYKVAMVTAQMGQLTQARALPGSCAADGEAVVATAASLEPEMAVHSQRQLASRSIDWPRLHADRLAR